MLKITLLTLLMLLQLTTTEQNTIISKLPTMVSMVKRLGLDLLGNSPLIPKVLGWLIQQLQLQI